MIFILGVITGLLLAIITILVVKHFETEVSQVVKKAKRVTQKKAVIFNPKTETQLARDYIVSENAKKGEPTPLEDL